jgi:hypothetical protein
MSSADAERHQPMEPIWRATGFLGGARGTCEGDTFGTEHLLAGVLSCRGRAREAMAAAGVTPTVLTAVLRDVTETGREWTAGDDAGAAVPSVEVVGETQGYGDRALTGAAARAFGHAVRRARGSGASEYSPEDLLRGLLEEPDNRAAELLDLCGSSRAAVLDLLEGRGAPEDGCDPLLRETRDALLGRRRYPLPLWKRLFSSGVNWAVVPGLWVQLETYEGARRLGHRTVGTEHLLLAVLATHEVAMAHPYLAKEGTEDPARRFAGGATLHARGVGHAAVHAELAAGRDGRSDLGGDPVDVGRFLREVPATGTTGPLVDRLLSGHTRAARLLELLELPGKDAA